MKSRLPAALSLIALFSIILVGCSADQLVSAGSTLGRLKNAGTGHGGDGYVQSATENVRDFVNVYESCVNYDWSVRKTDASGKERVDGNIAVYPFEEVLARLDSTILVTASTLVRAAQGSSPDSGLRAALDTPYKSYQGRTVDWYCYKRLGDFFQVSDQAGAIATAILGTGVDMRRLNEAVVPFPMQVSDLLVIVNKAFDMTKHTGFLLKILKTNQGRGLEGARDIDLSFITEGIAAYVGGRMEMTVGDKITVCLLYDAIDLIIRSLDLYVEQHPEEKDAAGFYTYASFTARWILENCGEDLDRLMTDIEAVGYIYDFNIDVAGLADALL